MRGTAGFAPNLVPISKSSVFIASNWANSATYVAPSGANNLSPLALLALVVNDITTIGLILLSLSEDFKK